MITKKERIGKRGHSFTFFRWCTKEDCKNQFLPCSKHSRVCPSCLKLAHTKRNVRSKMTNIRTIVKKAKDLGINYKVGTPKRIVLTVSP